MLRSIEETAAGLGAAGRGLGAAASARPRADFDALRRGHHAAGAPPARATRCALAALRARRARRRRPRWRAPSPSAGGAGAVRRRRRPRLQPARAAAQLGASAMALICACHAYGWPVARGGSQRDRRRAGRGRARARRQDRDRPAGALAGGAARGRRGRPRPGAGRGRRDRRRAAAAPGSPAPTAATEHGPGAFKVDLAVEGGVPWADAAGPAGRDRARDRLLRGDRRRRARRQPRPDAGASLRPRRPAVPRRPARAREGDVHPVWAYAHVPHGYDGDATEALLDQIERFAPGLRERILARAGPLAGRARGPQRRTTSAATSSPAPTRRCSPWSGRAWRSIPTRPASPASSSARRRRRPAPAPTACAATTPPSRCSAPSEHPQPRHAFRLSPHPGGVKVGSGGPGCKLCRS